MLHLIAFWLAPLALANASPAPVACPDPAQAEAAEDCPWAGIARTLIRDAGDPKANPKESIKESIEEFRSLAPNLAREINGDNHLLGYKALWGTSINYDELAKGIVVDPAILAVIRHFFGYVPSHRGELTPAGHPLAHAGMEHTYGYLFSVLKTPYGYKRARWVEADIENGFGLPRGMLGPETGQGSLFANATYLAGRIAFAKGPAQLRVLDASAPFVGSPIRGIDYAKLSIKRLEEKVQLAGDRTVRIRTDFVAFPVAPKDPAANSHLLVYSVADSASEHPVIITEFPVQRSFVDMALKPENLGAGKPVQTRYNAYVPGITDIATLKGDRRVR